MIFLMSPRKSKPSDSPDLCKYGICCRLDLNSAVFLSFKRFESMFCDLFDTKQCSCFRAWSLGQGFRKDFICSLFSPLYFACAMFS